MIDSYPQRWMLPSLIKKLNQEPDITSYRLEEWRLWEMFENNCAHFVVRRNQIVGCCLIYHDHGLEESNPAYLELGTVWSQKEDRSSIVKELGESIPQLAKGKKIMTFCRKLKLAQHFEQSPVFPFNKIANSKTCPRELIASFSQFKGWLDDVEISEKYERVLYLQDDREVTPWYLVYEQ